MIKAISRSLLGLLMLTSLAHAAQNQAAEKAGLQEFQSLDEQVQTLKEEVLKINHELMLLEEKLVYPSSSQVAIFVSVEPSQKFSLDSIELKLDNKTVSRHIYTYREMEALRKGGVQRLHTGNLVSGTHKIDVTVAGHTTSNNAYKSNAGFSIKKQTGPKLVEVKIVNTNSSKPTVVIKDWQ